MPIHQYWASDQVHLTDIPDGKACLKGLNQYPKRHVKCFQGFVTTGYLIVEEMSMTTFLDLKPCSHEEECIPEHWRSRLEEGVLNYLAPQPCPTPHATLPYLLRPQTVFTSFRALILPCI